MDSTYIKIEVKGRLNDGELRSLSALLQSTADEVVQGTQDFYGSGTTPPEDEL